MSNISVTVTTTATLLIASNLQRLSLLITNAGSETVYIGHDEDVTVNNGIPLVIQKHQYLLLK